MKELKENEVIEVLPDGTVYYFDLDVCNKVADDALDEIFAKEGVEPNFDFTASIFHLFVETIYILSNSGWSTEELLGEVLTHSGAEFTIVDDDADDEDDD